MLAEIISIGDELTCGKILDTNSQWLSRELSDLGIRVLYHTTVGDDFEANVKIFRAAFDRADVVIATGGLGPTADDLTRESLAEAFGAKLQPNEKALESIKALFAKRGYSLPPANEKQALIPVGANVVPNPNGTAPGIDWTIKRKEKNGSQFDVFRIVALPGVPAEMKEMWNETVRDNFEKHCQTLTGQDHVIRFRSIHCFGSGESQIEAMLPDLVNRSHFPTVGITADRAVITLRIQTEGTSEADCLEQMKPTAKIIYDNLGQLIFGEGDDTLASVVCDHLKKTGKTLSVMEWGTRGLLDESLASAPNSLGCFYGGLVVRSAEAFRNTIRYSSELSQTQEIPHDFSDEAIAKDPQMNEKIVALMCRHALKVFRSDYSLAIGPYPTNQTDRLPVFVAFASAEETSDGQLDYKIQTQSFQYGGHPALIDELYVKRTLNLMRLNR